MGVSEKQLKRKWISYVKIKEVSYIKPTELSSNNFIWIESDLSFWGFYNKELCTQLLLAFNQGVKSQTLRVRKVLFTSITCDSFLNICVCKLPCCLLWKGHFNLNLQLNHVNEPLGGEPRIMQDGETLLSWTFQVGVLGSMIQWWVIYNVQSYSYNTNP